MNSNIINKLLSPVKVLVIYASREQYTKQYYIEQREVTRVGSKNVIGPATAMPDDALNGIAKSIAKTNGDAMKHETLIGEHILYAPSISGRTIVIWYRKAQQRQINFGSKVGRKDDVTVKVPATLYVVDNKKLYVFALENDSRPTLKTKIYHAPFFNIYADGNVCLGTAPVGKSKAATFEKEAERFERGFYLAEQNGGAHSTASKRTLEAVWKEVIKTKSAYPKKELVQHSKYKTLEGLINSLTGKNVPHYEPHEEE